MKISTFEYFTKEAIASLRKNSLMSIASISTVTLSMLVLGMFLVIALNLNNIASALESEVQISAYLKDEVQASNFDSIKAEILKVDGVKEIKFISKEEAFERFTERLGDQKELLNALEEGGNPLPNAFEVEVRDSSKIGDIAQAIGQINGVESTKFGQEVIEQVFAFTKILRVLGVIFIIFLTLVTLFIISNTIRITVFARRQEIGIMKFVGATDKFIRWPFLIEGMILGLFGSVFASIILYQIYGIVCAQIYSSLAFLPLIPISPFLIKISAFLVLIGTGIGALGSTISLKRFLNV